MKQVLQNLSSGKSELVKAPAPKSKSGHLLIDTTVSLISSGTERMLVDFGKANLIQKARQQPEKVVQVLDKIKTDGLFTTVDAVRSKLGQPIPLGYCNVGVVKDVGKNIQGFAKGDRVISNGSHADVVRVPKNLCAVIPDQVSDDEASFTVVASIGLQGIRLAQPTLGEAFVVTGVGLIGLLTVQLLLAQGCRVLAIDFDQAKLEIAKSMGAEICNPGKGENPVSAGLAFSRGIGVDGVIITASTKSNDPVTEAARMSRKRGRIIMVGVTGLELNRADFYEKELSFQVSCSYGPGRYDSDYEEDGQDYPIGFVRWTEQRNFEAVLDMMACKKIDVRPLITHRFEFENAPQAYQLLSDDKSALGILLDYKHDIDSRHIETLQIEQFEQLSSEATNPVVGFIGAGNYASRILIPAFKSAKAGLHTVASSGGVSSVVEGKRLGIANATTDVESIFVDYTINTIAIATRHNTHAELTIKALNAGKHIFVEKPLALTHDELNSVQTAHQKSNSHLMVGFNRRFAPQIQTMKKLLDATSEPKAFSFMMNAGNIPAEHWTQDLDVGGGRIIGEACHMIDLMRFLAGSKITDIQARCMGKNSSTEVTEDKAVITLSFEDGSLGTIHYFANGGSSFPKERIEAFAAGGTLQIDNFIKMKGFNWPGFKKQNLIRQDKGQSACVSAFVEAIKNGEPTPIKADELFEVSKATIEAAQTMRNQT